MRKRLFPIGDAWRGLKTIHSIPLGTWGKKKEACGNGAGIQPKQDNMFEKLFEGQIRNDCKLKMHFMTLFTSMKILHDFCKPF